jgi:hypothetical protein
MRIPSRLLCLQDSDSNTPYLQFFEDTRIVRTADLSKIDREITWHEAFALALRGEIEGVAVSSGRIKYFRVLLPEERPEQLKTPGNGIPGEVEDPDGPGGGSLMPGSSREGVYREKVHSSEPEGLTIDGEPLYPVIGSTYQFYHQPEAKTLRKLKATGPAYR